MSLDGGPERISTGEPKPGYVTLPSPFADTEVDHLSEIRKSSGRIVWAYYLGRAVTASKLMYPSGSRFSPVFPDYTTAVEYYRESVKALEDMIEEAKNDRLLRAGYNKGAIHELIARNIVLPSRVA